MLSIFIPILITIVLILIMRRIKKKLTLDSQIGFANWLATILAINLSAATFALLIMIGSSTVKTDESRVLLAAYITNSQDLLIVFVNKESNNAVRFATLNYKKINVFETAHVYNPVLVHHKTRRTGNIWVINPFRNDVIGISHTLLLPIGYTKVFMMKRFNYEG